MKKKKRLSLVLLVSTLAAVGVYQTLLGNKPSPLIEECPFCNPTVIERQRVFETDQLLVLVTHKPITTGHCLLIPKRHVERFEELTSEEIAQIGEGVKRVHQTASKVYSATSYLLLQKNGKAVGQSVPHLHVHYIPRKAGEESMWKFAWGWTAAYLSRPLSQEQMHTAVAQLQQMFPGKEASDIR